MKSKTILMFFAILLTLSALLPMAFGTTPSWNLVSCNPDEEDWNNLSVSFWHDTIDLGEPLADRTFIYDYDLTAHNFGKFTTEVKLDQGRQIPLHYPTTFGHYWIMLSGTSKNTQTAVEFGWHVELENFYITGAWQFLYTFYRIDQNGQETSIAYSQDDVNYMIDVEIECEKTGGSNWWTVVTFTQNNEEIENVIFDYIDKPTITREYEHPKVTVPTYCQGWSSVGSLIAYPTLTVSKQGQGNVEPDLGKYRLPSGTEIEFEAFETTPYYVFDYWLINGAIQSEENPITVELGSHQTLVAKFAVVGGGGECPMTYSWNGTDLIYEGLVPIHDPEGSDVIGSLDITGDVVTEGDFYKFRLEEYPTTESFIDQVQLYGIKENGNEKLLSLESAEHSRYGDVLSEVKDSDDVRVNIDGWEHSGYTHFDDTIDLLFKAGSGEYETFRIVIEGHNIEFKQ